MKNKKTTIRHGELLIVSGDANMSSSKRVKDYIAAHSETGHHHIVEGECGVLERPGSDTFIEIYEETEVSHNKVGGHAPVKIPEGIYRLLKKREYDPFSKIVREVRD